MKRLTLMPSHKEDKLIAIAGYFTLVLGAYLAIVYFSGRATAHRGSGIALEPAPSLGIFQILLCLIVLCIILNLGRKNSVWFSRVSALAIICILIFQTLLNGGWRGF